MTRVFEVKEPRLKKYFDKASTFAKCSEKIKIQQVPQELNQRADELVKEHRLVFMTRS